MDGARERINRHLIDRSRGSAAIDAVDPELEAGIEVDEPAERLEAQAPDAIERGVDVSHDRGRQRTRASSSNASRRG
jgi:hypothetical protein